MGWGFLWPHRIGCVVRIRNQKHTKPQELCDSVLRFAIFRDGKCSC